MQKSKESMSRTQMLSWINRTLNINETRIENLGSGLVYCLLLNHYYPGTIQNFKIVMMPRNQNDYRTNLRRFQQGLSSQDIKSISFDVFKVSEMTYAQNWSLICKIYKQFQSMDKQKCSQYGKESKQMWWGAKVSQAKPQQTIPTFSLSCNSIMMNPLSTPQKGSKFLEQGKSRWQSMNLIEQIKKIVSVDSLNDRVKVSQLRNLLGLHEQQSHQYEPQQRDLLSDYKKKQQIIHID